MNLSSLAEAKILVHNTHLTEVKKRPREESETDDHENKKARIELIFHNTLPAFPLITDDPYTLKELKDLEKEITIVKPPSEEDRLLKEILTRPTLTLHLKVPNSSETIEFPINTALYAHNSKYFKTKLLSSMIDKEFNFEFGYEEFAFIDQYLKFGTLPSMKYVKSVLQLADFLDIPKLCEFCTKSLEEFMKKLSMESNEDLLTLIELVNDFDILTGITNLKISYESILSKTIEKLICTAKNDPLKFQERKKLIKENLKAQISIHLSGLNDSLAFSCIKNFPIQSLKLSHCTNLNHNSLKVLPLLSFLETLTLENNFIDNPTLEILSNCRRLKVLKLIGDGGSYSGRLLTDDGFKNLPSGLHTLHLENLGSISSEGILYLQSLKNLKSLTTNNLNIDDSFLLLFPDNLEELTLERCYKLNAVRNLGHLKQLKTLCLHNLKINDSGFVNFTSDSIVHLQLVNCDITDKCFEHFARMKNLMKLTIDCSRVRPEHLEKLKKTTKIEISNKHDIKVERPVNYYYD